MSKSFGPFSPQRRSKNSLLTRLVDLAKNVCIMNLVEKVQPSYQTGLVSNEYLLLNRPVWYEVGAYFLPDWSGMKAVLFSTRFILLTDKPTCIGNFQDLICP